MAKNWGYFLLVSILAIPALSQENIKCRVINSPPKPPKGLEQLVCDAETLRGAVVLEGVPTSTWTYGCTATTAGMLFGYYDRHGYPNMYTGPTNNGVAPLTDLGQGDDPNNPIEGACSIIATQNGFDGRTTRGHVDDYWINADLPGPDPWTYYGTEHSFGECTADYMGTNQWRWYDSYWDDSWNVDGATMVWSYFDGAKMHDFIPPAEYGYPQTACCHGMRLFAESRGYDVQENYTQNTDTEVGPTGFTFEDLEAEIDAGRPVMIHTTHVQGGGHTMLAVGYDPSSQSMIIHNTWDNQKYPMAWNGLWSGYYVDSVTVFKLAPIDCNNNGVGDQDDLQNCDGSAWCSDCNQNAIIDVCDIGDGVSVDCNNNGIPDECDLDSGFSEDCNGNQVPDTCDVASGASLDVNGNDLPDECEDCNSNTIVDEYDLRDCAGEPWCLDCNTNGQLDECDIADGTSHDNDGNGTPDECPPPDDCNFNGLLDEVEIVNCDGSLTCADCNENTILDICELSSGDVHDCNDDMIPDECEQDCDGNGVLDECEIKYVSRQGSPAQAVVSNDQYILFTQGLDVYIVSADDPTTTAGKVTLPDAPRGIAVDGDYLYIANGKLGLQIVSISDVSDPQIVGAVDTPGYARGVAVSGTYAYIADQSAGLTIINIADPASPAIEATLDTPGSSWGVDVIDNYVIVADYHKGIQIVNVSAPDSPTYAATVDTEGYATAVDIDGRFVYVACRGGGLSMINIANKSNPFLVGTYDTAGNVWDVQVKGGYAYVADYSQGMIVLDVLDPINIFEVDHMREGDAVVDVEVTSDSVYAACNTYGVLMFKRIQIPDCNGNDSSDTCELADGTLHDVNNNGVVDECEMDANDDSQIDISDFAKFQICFGSQDETCLDQFDFDNDGSIDLADFSLFEAQLTGP